METLLHTGRLEEIDYNSLYTLLKNTIISIRRCKSLIGFCTRSSGADRIGQRETASLCPTKSDAFDTQSLHCS
jgi:hypothetical protein